MAAVALLASAAASPRARAAEASLAPSSSGPPALETASRPEIALGVLQGVAGYALAIGGTVGAFETGLNPKSLGWRSDAANALFVGAMAPALAAGAVCGTGLLSSRYRGRCGPTLLGAYAGAALGALLGLLVAPSPGPDDTQAFVSSIYAAGGIMLLAPMGALAGYHLGKEPLARNEAPSPSVGDVPQVSGDVALVSERRPSRAVANQPPQMIFSLVNLSW